jgi:hypothetical protein
MQAFTIGWNFMTFAGQAAAACHQGSSRGDGANFCRDRPQGGRIVRVTIAKLGAKPIYLSGACPGMTQID